MSPRAEVLRTTRGMETTMLRIDLLSPEDLDTNLLDARLKEAADSTKDLDEVKFIVVGGKLIAFNKRQKHAREYEDLERVFGISGKPQCGGSISFNFTGDETLGPRRRIYDHSVSLAYTIAPANRLSTEDSDHYKETVLREKLGEHFVIE